MNVYGEVLRKLMLSVKKKKKKVLLLIMHILSYLIITEFLIVFH